MTALPGRIVLVTGAAGGIGRRMALEAAGHGATVVAWDIDGSRLDVLVKEIDEMAPGRGHGYVCDVTDPEAVSSTARTVESEVGPVDVLILNAGVINGKLLWELSDADIEVMRYLTVTLPDDDSVQIMLLLPGPPILLRSVRQLINPA